MKFLNAQQLAFVLDIKKEDARAKMCVAWSSDKGEENKAERNAKGKLVDPYPVAMPIDMLAEKLNLPTLQQSVDDICENYLKRPASKKWILCDFPEKHLAKNKEAGQDKVINIPSALKSFLKKEDRELIANEWQARYAKDKLRVGAI
jgi:hypothetical protein